MEPRRGLVVGGEEAAATAWPDRDVPALRRRFVRDHAPAQPRITPAAPTIDEGAAPVVAAARDATLRRLLMLADVLAASIALLAAVSFVGEATPLLTSLAILPLVVLASRAMGLYDRDDVVLSKTTLNEAPSLLHLATLATLILVAGQEVFVEGRLGPADAIVLWTAFLLASVLCRSTIRHLGLAAAQPERCIVVGDPERLVRIGEKLRKGWALNAEVVVSLPFSELPATDEARTMIASLIRRHGAHRLIVATGDLDSDRLLSVIREAKALGVKVSVQPRLLNVVGSAVEFEDVHGDIFLAVRCFGLSSAEWRAKRVMDVLGAAILLIAVAPLLAVCAVAIKLDSRGPVFFRQQRVGRDGCRFWIWKLRTMTADAEARRADLADLNEAEGGLFKIAHDPRVTRVGRLLRRTAFDELPQLLNVLRGEMSLVGPRPLVADEDERIVGWHRRRLHLVPGMTGLWQVLGSARIPLQDMVALDYLYIVNWSVWRDVQILLRTVGFVLRGRGL